MYKTDDNLKNAFAIECQAHIRYTLFAAKAEMEGHTELARLFRAAAQAELVHARNHFNVMGGIGSTKDNILAAATSEHYEITRVYPTYIEDSQIDRNEGARITFNLAFKAEQVHNEIFEKTFTSTKSGQKIANDLWYVCQVCGNLVAKEAPPKCSICNNPIEKFNKVD
jgi:rubrerythrin